MLGSHQGPGIVSPAWPFSPLTNSQLVRCHDGGAGTKCFAFGRHQAGTVVDRRNTPCEETNCYQQKGMHSGVRCSDSLGEIFLKFLKCKISCFFNMANNLQFCDLAMQGGQMQFKAHLWAGFCLKAASLSALGFECLL